MRGKDALIDKEYSFLRQEYLDLKNCQVTFLTFSIIATGAILGVLGGRIISVGEPYAPMLYLAPLTILLPSWLVFFDKALSVTRIVGYLRFLEDVRLRYENPSVVILGWETAMAKFRKRRRQEKERWSIGARRDFREKICRILLLKTTQRYWVLTYYTFLGACIFCLSLSLAAGLSLATSPAIRVKSVLFGFELFLLLAFVIATGFVAYWNLRILIELIWGKHSYDEVYGVWKLIHGSMGSVSRSHSWPAAF